MGAYDTQEVQIYKEAAYGVTGVPTARLMGLEDATFNPKTPAKVFRQLHGSLGVGNLGARIFSGGDGNLKGVESYEDIGYRLENIFGIVVPTGGGAMPAIASSTAANPSVVTMAAPHGLLSGMTTTISGHLVNTAINGTWPITVLSTTTFSVPVLGNGVGAATGAITPATLPYLRSGQAPLAVASLNPRFMSLIKGDADGAYNMIGAMIEEYTLTCEQNETKSELMFDAKLICKNIVTGAVLAVLSDRLVLPITASDFSIFVDPAGSAPGTTLLPTTAFGFEVKLVNNRKAKQHLGNIGIDAIDQLGWEPDKQLVKLNMEFNASSKAIIDSLMTATPWQRNVRFRAVNGASMFQLDMGVQGKDTPVLMANKGGIKAVDVECEAFETVGLGNWLKYQTANGLAALL